MVRAPDGAIGIDPTSKAAGRGAYLCLDGACLSLALRRKSLPRALRAEVPAQVVEDLQRDLATLSPVLEKKKE